MKTKQTLRQPRPILDSLIESGKAVRRKARDTGTLRGWWVCAIGNVRDLLGAAKNGDDVKDNLDMAYAILEHLRLIVEDRVGNACSCQGNQPTEASMSLLNQTLFGAMMDILLASAISDSEWGACIAFKNQIKSALRKVPTLAGIGKLASELGIAPTTDDIPVPVVRQGAPTRCRDCGQEFRETAAGM